MTDHFEKQRDDARLGARTRFSAWLEVELGQGCTYTPFHIVCYEGEPFYVEIVNAIKRIPNICWIEQRVNITLLDHTANLTFRTDGTPHLRTKP